MRTDVPQVRLERPLEELYQLEQLVQPSGPAAPVPIKQWEDVQLRATRFV